MKYSVVYAIVYTPYSCVLHKCHTRIAYHCIPLYAIAYRFCIPLHTIVCDCIPLFAYRCIHSENGMCDKNVTVAYLPQCDKKVTVAKMSQGCGQNVTQLLRVYAIVYTTYSYMQKTECVSKMSHPQWKMTPPWEFVPLVGNWGVDPTVGI